MGLKVSAVSSLVVTPTTILYYGTNRKEVRGWECREGIAQIM